MIDPNLFQSLSPAERRVLLLAADHSNGQIASAIGISQETVKTHLANAKVKLGGLERRAASRGLRNLEPIDPPPSGGSPDRGIPPDPGHEPAVATVEALPRLEPARGARFAADTTAIRIRLMLVNTLLLAGIIVLSLVIGRELVRLTQAYWDGAPLTLD